MGSGNGPQTEIGEEHAAEPDNYGREMDQDKNTVHEGSPVAAHLRKNPAPKAMAAIIVKQR